MRAWNLAHEGKSALFPGGDATISWTSVTAVDAPRCALVPTIVALRRIEAGEFVMLDYGIHYDMDNKSS